MGEKNHLENFSNDKRIKGGVNSTCKLCREVKNLKLSHIVPKWAYKAMKSEDNGRISGHFPSLMQIRILQDGSKNYLLCGDCEQLLGKGERYLQKLQEGSADDREFINVTNQGDYYTGIDYDLVKQFILGLALKAHYATAPPFHGIQIPIQKHISYIRKNILHENSDDSKMLIYAIRFISTNPSINVKSLVVPFCMLNEDGVYTFTILMGGWEWVLIIYENKKTFKNPFYYPSLKRGELSYIPVGNIMDHRMFTKEFKEKKPLTFKEIAKIQHKYK